MAILLNGIECPPLASTRDLEETNFSMFMRKENQKNREEERVSGIPPEITEIYKLLDEMIEIIESANLKHKSAAKEEAD